MQTKTVSDGRGCNMSSEFECHHEPQDVPMCIPRHLKCDGSDNCGDRSDESSSYAKCPWCK